MNSLISSLLATGATAAVALIVFGLPDIGPGVAEDEITGSITRSGAGTYQLDSGSASCTVNRGVRITPTVYRLQTFGDCDTVLEGLEAGLYWTDTSGGGIVLSGRNGTVLEFTQADGSHFESIRPERPLYTLSATR